MRIWDISETTTETLCSAFEDFINVKKAQQLGELALKDYKYQITRFIEASHNSLNYNLLEKDTLVFFAQIPPTSPARYNKPYQYINAFFNWLVKTEQIPKNPIRENALKKRHDDGNIKPIQPADLKKFMQSLDKKKYLDLRTYTVCTIILDCGIRAKELLSLKNADYDPEQGMLRIRKSAAKTRRERLLWLSPQSVRALNNFIRIKPKEWEDWLIPTYEGKQLTTTYLDRAFRKASISCGIKVTPYQLRHSFATLYLKNGGDLFSLQKQMGHSDVRMTRRYTEIDNDFVRKQHESFSPLLNLNRKERLRRIK